MRARLFASVLATTVGLAFWWSLTEPLPVPPAVLLGVPAVVLFCSGLIAGRLGLVAAPLGLLFSLLLGSLIATQLHQYYVPAHEPVSSFGRYVNVSIPELVPLLIVGMVIGLAGGLVGERALR